jgi:hypothetical protein
MVVHWRLGGARKDGVGAGLRRVGAAVEWARPFDCRLIGCVHTRVCWLSMDDSIELLPLGLVNQSFWLSIAIHMYILLSKASISSI